MDTKRKGLKTPWSEWKIEHKVLAIAGGVAGGAGLLALLGFVVMWLWNWLMPELFGLPAIGYWEAWGIFILAHILLGGSHAGRSNGERSRKRKLEERLASMRKDEAAPKEEGQGA